MKRWIIGACLVATAACQTNEQTTAVEQAASECHPGGNFPYAKLPTMNMWNGQTPWAGPGQLLMDQKDPYVPGRHYAFLVEPGKGKIWWGVIVPDQQLPAYRASVHSVEPMIGDCCRPPPPPPGGSDWIARNVLEAGLIYLEVPFIAEQNAGP